MALVGANPGAVVKVDIRARSGDLAATFAYQKPLNVIEDICTAARRARRFAN